MKKLLSALALGLMACAANAQNVATPAPYVASQAIGFGTVGGPYQAVDPTHPFPVAPANPPALSLDKSLRVTTSSASPTYYFAVSGMTPAASPTDIAYIGATAELRTALVKRISIRAVADAAGLVPVKLLTGGQNGYGTTVTPAAADLNSPYPSVTVSTFAANPSLVTGRPAIEVGQLQIGTAAAPAPPLVFEWGENEQPPVVRAIFGRAGRVLFINLGGATLPANTRLDINVTTVEEPVRRIIFWGDSHFDIANYLFADLAQYPSVLGYTDIRNYGSSGKKLLDALPTAAQNTRGLNYDIGTLVSSLPPFGASPVVSDVVMDWGTNDISAGGVSLGQMISRYDAMLYILKNGCVSGQSWTSTKAGGDGTTFTWNATIAARPNVRIWLWGQNSYLADDPTSSGAIPIAGWPGTTTLAQAAQAATDLEYAVMQAFVGDPRVAGVLQAQDYVSPTTGYSFGRTVRPIASNPLMQDRLHSNSVGQAIKAEQISAALGL